MLCALIVPVGNFVSAASEEGVKAALSTGAGLGYLAAALAVGLSCVGSGIAVAAGAPAAIGATSEDPKNFVKALIFICSISFAAATERCSRQTTAPEV